MKKVFRRLVSLALALTMALSLAVSASATFPEESEDSVTGGIVTPGLHNFTQVNTYTEGQYSDVPASHTFSENAKAAYEYNIMQGYGTTFGVGNNITRLASIIIACRLNCIYYDGSNHIDESYSGTTQERYMAYAKDFGILCDFDDVSKNATRAEFAAILASAFPDEALPAINTVVDNAIPDVTMDTNYAADIYRLYRAGILNGSDALGTFYPDSYINRGAACAIATRMCAEALRKSVNLDSDYATLLSETITAMGDKYLIAAEAISACAVTIQTAAEIANFTLNATAYAYYQEAIATLEAAAALCGNHAALKEIKSLTNSAVNALVTSIPASYNINSATFSEAMLIGLQTALVPMQYAAVKIDTLMS